MPRGTNAEASLDMLKVICHQGEGITVVVPQSGSMGPGFFLIGIIGSGQLIMTSNKLAPGGLPIDKIRPHVFFGN